MEVSTPYRDDKNFNYYNVFPKEKFVSTPYRDDKNYFTDFICFKSFIVSIPYRDDKNTSFLGSISFGLLFQSLIGTIKTVVRYNGNFYHITFQSLIGTIKTSHQECTNSPF